MSWLKWLLENLVEKLLLRDQFIVKGSGKKLVFAELDDARRFAFNSSAEDRGSWTVSKNARVVMAVKGS